MRRTPSLLATLALTLLLGACEESTTPLQDGPSVARHGAVQIQKQRKSTPKGAKTVTAGPAGSVRQARNAPKLDHTRRTFRAVQGKKSTFEIYYESRGRTAEKYLSLTIPASAQLVDEEGNALNPGESTDVTIEVDPETFAFRFGPHGSTFRGVPATLSVSLHYADWSENSALDAMHLKLWYQTTAGEPWELLPTEVTYDPVSQDATAPLDHFSNYAVGW